MEKASTNNSNKKQLLLKKVFSKDLIVSAIIPIMIFSIFDRIGMTIVGIILSGVWSIGVVCIDFVKEHTINALASISGIFAAMGIIGTIISKNPTFYLVSPIVQDILLALMFFGSLLFERSLIQVIAEQSYLKNVPEDFKKQAKYKNAWRIVTAAWAILSVSQAALRIILVFSMSMSSYYAISTVYGNVSSTILFAFTIMFPGWYWKRVK